MEAARARRDLRGHAGATARWSWAPCRRPAPPDGPPRAEGHHLRDRRPPGAGARGHDARRRRQARRRRDPLLLLRAQARPAGRRLPHVPGRDRGHPEAADLLLDAGARRHGRQHDLRPRQARAERGRRVPARQPPARLPGLRQGRRVPAAGHLLRLGRRPLAHDRAQAPLQEAARALAAGRDRPRALHPLLPLRALLAGGRRGLPARLPRARRPHLRRHPRRPPVRGAVQRQHHRALPGGRADLDRLPLPRAAVGHRGRRHGLHRLRGAVQRDAHGPRRRARSCACSSRDNDEVDDGWICDKGRFGYQAFRSDGAHHRAARARRRLPARGLVGARAGRGRRGAEARPARGPPRSSAARPPTRRASSSSTCCATALGSPHVDSRAAGRARPATTPARWRGPGSTAKVSDIDHADAILVLDVEPVDEAPILDLRVRKAVRRNGAKLVVASAPPLHARRQRRRRPALRARRRRGAAVTALAAALGSPRASSLDLGDLAQRAGATEGFRPGRRRCHAAPASTALLDAGVRAERLGATRCAPPPTCSRRGRRRRPLGRAARRRARRRPSRRCSRSPPRSGSRTSRSPG